MKYRATQNTPWCNKGDIYEPAPEEETYPYKQLYVTTAEGSNNFTKDPALFPSFMKPLEKTDEQKLADLLWSQWNYPLGMAFESTKSITLKIAKDLIERGIVDLSKLKEV